MYLCINKHTHTCMLLWLYVRVRMQVWCAITNKNKWYMRRQYQCDGVQYRGYATNKILQDSKMFQGLSQEMGVGQSSTSFQQKQVLTHIVQATTQTALAHSTSCGFQSSNIFKVWDTFPWIQTWYSCDLYWAPLSQISVTIQLLWGQHRRSIWFIQIYTSGLTR